MTTKLTKQSLKKQTISLKKKITKPVKAKLTKPRITSINAKQDLLMKSLTTYFKGNKKNLRKMVKIIQGKSPISLRIIDWFVTNYSKKNNTTLKKPRKSKNKDYTVLSIHHNYKTQLKSFSKKQFDPFRRNTRIDFEYETGKTIETTVAQLNFFRWAFKNEIIEYIQKHYKIIEKDMFENSKKSKNKKISASASCNKLSKNVTRIVVDFF